MLPRVWPSADKRHLGDPRAILELGAARLIPSHDVQGATLTWIVLFAAIVMDGPLVVHCPAPTSTSHTTRTG